MDVPSVEILETIDLARRVDYRAFDSAAEEVASDSGRVKME